MPLSRNLDNYKKLPAAQGAGTGAGNYIDIYHTGDNTITRICSVAICNSSLDPQTFSLWEVSNTIWPVGQVWEGGSVAEPAIAIKDRLFYQNEIPSNTTYIMEVEIIVDQKQYMIFEAPGDISITMWAEEEGNH